MKNFLRYFNTLRQCCINANIKRAALFLNRRKEKTSLFLSIIRLTLSEFWSDCKIQRKKTIYTRSNQYRNVVSLFFFDDALREIAIFCLLFIKTNQFLRKCWRLMKIVYIRRIIFIKVWRLAKQAMPVVRSVLTLSI